MNKYLIFVEGIADSTFLRDYLIFLFNDLSIKNHGKNEKVLENQNTSIKIRILGGKDAIKEGKIKNTILDAWATEHKIITIQDADNRHDYRKAELQNIKADLLEEFKQKFPNVNPSFDIFLLPDNQNDGELEDLLLKIAKTEYFEKTNNCYTQWIECIKTFSTTEIVDERYSNKSLIFNYFANYYGMKGAREENRRYEKDYWDFSHITLEPLKDFLTQIITDVTGHKKI